MALGWFNPSRCNSYDCNCYCTCPNCTMYTAEMRTWDTSLAKCRLYWECCASGGETINLEGESYDHGEVGPKGSIDAEDGETYTLIASHLGCYDRTITLEMPIDCPCAEGCGGLTTAGRVPGARPTATMTVSNWTAGSSVQAIPPCGVVATDTYTYDFTVLNHTATFDVLSKTYISEDGEACSYEYIEPVQYYIGDVTITRTRFNGFTSVVASVTYSVYGVVHPSVPTHPTPDGATIGQGYQLKFVRIASTTPSTTMCAGFGAPPYVLYSLGDSAASSVTHWTAHAPFDNCTIYAGFPAPSGVLAHYPWCARSTCPSDENEYRSHGSVSAFFGHVPNSRYVWESLL